MRLSVVWVSMTVVWASGLLAGCGESSEWESEESPQATECMEQCAKIEAGLPWCFGEGWSLWCEESCEDRGFAALVELCEKCREVHGVRSLCDEDVCPYCASIIWD